MHRISHGPLPREALYSGSETLTTQARDPLGQWFTPPLKIHLTLPNSITVITPHGWVPLYRSTIQCKVPVNLLSLISLVQRELLFNLLGLITPKLLSQEIFQLEVLARAVN